MLIMEAHIIPRVLQRGFRVDLPQGVKDTYDPDNARVNIFIVQSKEYKKNRLVREVSTRTDFYGDEIELFLQNKFETPFGRLKTRLNDFKNPRYTKISTNDFELLQTFSANMWRRSDTHLTSKYRNQKLSDDELKKKLYSKESLDIDRNNLIFLKTSFCYETFIIFNETKINFPLHNKHATIRNYENIDMFPDYIFEPITKSIMMIHKRRDSFRTQEKKIYLRKPPSFMNEDEVRIQTRIINEDDTIKNIIKTYCLIESPVDYYICDDTNIGILKDTYNAIDDYLKATNLFKTKYSKIIF